MIEYIALAILFVIMLILISIRELLAGQSSGFDDLTWRGKLYRWARSLREKRVI